MVFCALQRGRYKTSQKQHILSKLSPQAVASHAVVELSELEPLEKVVVAVLGLLDVGPGQPSASVFLQIRLAKSSVHLCDSPYSLAFRSCRQVALPSLALKTPKKLGKLNEPIGGAVPGRRGGCG